jgi:hypothetical protein
MKFMLLNFPKDLLWVVFWLKFLPEDKIPLIFLAGTFLILSLVLHYFVIKRY